MFMAPVVHVLLFPSERAGGTSKRASGNRRAAETDDDALLQEAGGAQGEEAEQNCTIMFLFVLFATF